MGARIFACVSSYIVYVYVVSAVVCEIPEGMEYQFV